MPRYGKNNILAHHYSLLPYMSRTPGRLSSYHLQNEGGSGGENLAATS
jgi:hypothetical protein